MKYSYETQKDRLFTPEGMQLLLGVRDRVQRIVEESGAIRMQEAMKLPRGCSGACEWDLLACVDYMVRETNELREIPQDNVAGQHRVFVANN